MAAKTELHTWPVAPAGPVPEDPVPTLVLLMMSTEVVQAVFSDVAINYPACSPSNLLKPCIAILTCFKGLIESTSFCSA